MTTVIVNPGACGFTVTVKAEKQKDGKVALALDSSCEMVLKMLEDIAILDRLAPLAGFGSNPVHTSAAKHLKHCACVAPAGILKAVETEAGLNVAKDASIIFVKNE